MQKSVSNPCLTNVKDISLPLKNKKIRRHSFCEIVTGASAAFLATSSALTSASINMTTMHANNLDYVVSTVSIDRAVQCLSSPVFSDSHEFASCLLEQPAENNYFRSIELSSLLNNTEEECRRSNKEIDGENSLAD